VRAFLEGKETRGPKPVFHLSAERPPLMRYIPNLSQGIFPNEINCSKSNVDVGYVGVKVSVFLQEINIVLINVPSLSCSTSNNFSERSQHTE
jgi:hypothetical protein